MSLSKIMKQSAMQSCYLRKKNQEKTVTQQMIEGNKVAHEKAQSQYLEMRGQYKYQNLIINYSFDEIKVNEKALTLIEHKNIASGKAVEMWYFESCVLQTAVWKAFMQENPDKHLQTATFFRREGNPLMELDITNKFLNSELHMGEKVYHVQVLDPKRLVEFYCMKAMSTFDYESAKKFDRQFKFQEYNYLQDCLSFRQ